MYKEIPIETKIREILDILEGKQYLTFSEIAKIQTSRSAMVVCFMAVLELVKNKQVVAKQSELFEDIRIYRVYNDEENDESIVKEEKDELDLDIEKNKIIKYIHYMVDVFFIYGNFLAYSFLLTCFPLSITNS